MRGPGLFGRIIGKFMRGYRTAGCISPIRYVMELYVMELPEPVIIENARSAAGSGQDLVDPDF